MPPALFSYACEFTSLEGDFQLRHIPILAEPDKHPLELKDLESLLKVSHCCADAPKAH